MGTDLAFLDDMDGSGGYQSWANHRHQPYGQGTPIIGAPALSDAERRALYRPQREAKQRDDAWMAQAACRGMETNWWVPSCEVDGRGAVASVQARATCSGCPVRSECLAYALKHREHGFWGGCTQKQRDEMRRDQRTQQ
jgi:WhiB family transcriptional regulator, redox-sensing transcriptional regulator